MTQDMNLNPYPPEKIQQWLREKIAEYLFIDPEEIDEGADFNSFGLSSRDAVLLSGDLEEWLGRRLSPTLVYEYSNITALTNFLAKKQESQNGVSALEASPTSGKSKIINSSEDTREDEAVAIIGMACRFPGAENINEYWDVLKNGVDAITEVPPDRFDIDKFYDPRAGIPGKMNTRWGGFIKDIDRFDALFFGISPREAQRIDPQQRILAEVSWEALEDAGIDPSTLAGSSSGVFVGISSNDFGRILADSSDIDVYDGTGNAFSISANRLSYLFDIHGPSIAIDTACSSSLVSVHLASESLRRGECNLAIAGGVNLILSPELTIIFSQARMMSPTGRCKTFDSSADGYVRGEGCGMIVLKRLSDAIGNGDQILAVIKASAVNQDGHSNGLTAPNPIAQQAVIQTALEKANVKPEQINYIEAHGTGTSLGDPIEVKALSEVFCKGRNSHTPLKIGSVKTNIGHLESAAGVAGIIKVVLMLTHRAIVPSLHFSIPNPLIPFDLMPINVQTQFEAWNNTGEGARLAGISSFGFGGTNAHIILEEAPQAVQIAKNVENTSTPVPYLLPVSGKDLGALRANVSAYQKHFDLLAGSSTNTPEYFRSLVYTASTRRHHHPARVGLVGKGAEEMSHNIRLLLENGGIEEGVKNNIPSKPEQKALVAFVFSGQGSQWAGMGRSLMATQPVFRKEIERLDKLFFPLANWSIIDEIQAEEDTSRIGETEFAQPLIFSIQIGLTALWASWGIKPYMVTGHSVGEVAAAVVSGAITIEDGVKIIYQRGKLMQQATGMGKMAAIGISEAEALRVIEPYNGQVSVAAINSPTSVTLSGDGKALEEIQASANQRKVFNRSLPVNYAFHSYYMDSFVGDFQSLVNDITVRSPEIRLYSTVTGELYRSGDYEPKYWGQNIRKPVRFADVIEKMKNDGANIYIEIGPHPVLVRSIEECVGADKSEGILTTYSLRRNQEETESLLNNLRLLFERGVDLQWEAFFPEGGDIVHLPGYSWQRERYWPSQRLTGFQSSSKQNVMELFGTRVDLPDGFALFENHLNANSLGQIATSSIKGWNLIHISSIVEAILSAAEQVLESQPFQIMEFFVTNPFLILDDQLYKTNMIFSRQENGHSVCSFQCAEIKGDPVRLEWKKVADATLSANPMAGNELVVNGKGDFERYHSRNKSALPVEADTILNLEHIYTPFRTLQDVKVNGNSVTGMFRLNGRELQPIISAGELNALASLLVIGAKESLERELVLDGFEKLLIHQFKTPPVFFHIEKIMRDIELGMITGDVFVYGEDKTLIITIERLRVVEKERTRIWAILPEKEAYSVTESQEEKIGETTPTRILSLTEPEQQVAMIEGIIQGAVAKVLKISLDRVPNNQPVNYLGLDSIMAIDLKNRIEKILSVELPVVVLLQGPTIHQLSIQLLESLKAEKVDKNLEKELVEEHPDSGEYPLSVGQRAMWLQHQIAPSSVFNPVQAVRIKSEIDTNLFKTEFQKLINRHAALRTIFDSRNGVPVQVVRPTAEPVIVEEDARQWTAEDFRKVLIRNAYEVFDLQNGPLIRVNIYIEKNSSILVLISAHHLVVDLWSLAILTKELFQSITQENVDLPKLPARYVDYVSWQNQMLVSSEGNGHYDYWSNKLSGELPVLDFPTDLPRPAIQTYEGASVTQTFDEAFTNKIERFCVENGFTTYMLLLAAFKVLLYRYTSQEDLIIGTPTTGRSKADYLDLVGYFVNPVAIRSTVQSTDQFIDYLNQIRQVVIGAVNHQDYPFALLVEKLHPQRDASFLPIFQVMFVFQRAHLLYEEGLSQLAIGIDGLQMNLEGIVMESVNLDQVYSPFDFTLTLARMREGLGISVTYNTNLFYKTTMERFCNHFEELVKSVLEKPESELGTLSILGEKERHRLLVDWNQTERNVTPVSTTQEWFEAQVKETPNHIAVSFGDQDISYSEINKKANQLAHYLKSKGIGRGSIVGIFLERSIEMIVAILGVLKTGGAYLPLDPIHPFERLAFMLQDARVTILLTHTSLMSRLPTLVAQPVFMDGHWPRISQENDGNLSINSGPDDLAYVIYTSGSTGRSKGVLLIHRGLVNLVYSQTIGFKVNSSSRVLQFASFGFDASVSEIFMALLTGATLVLEKREVLLSTSELKKLLLEKRITTVTLPPSLLGVLSPDGYPDLQTIISAGESCPVDVAERWSEGRNFYNAYGPTEATIGPTYYKMEHPNPYKRSIPIGKPIFNTQIYILDTNMQPVPIGLPGEIYVGGAGVAKGYLNRPELTEEKFLINPFPLVSSHKTRSQTDRIYRTGDLGRFLGDGNIEYISRVDNQVKIRGFRIELGEIEAVINQIPAVHQAVVIVREDTPGDKRLVAYMVLRPGETLRKSEVRKSIREKLPEYMLPAAFEILDRFPVNASGKIDRIALAPPKGESQETEIPYVSPDSEIEKRIASIWQEVLQVNRVGLDDNFFDMGGHSLLIAKAHNSLQEALGREISMVQLFRYPTIRSLAEYLTKGDDLVKPIEKTIERADLQRESLKQRTEKMRSLAKNRKSGAR